MLDDYAYNDIDDTADGDVQKWWNGYEVMTTQLMEEVVVGMAFITFSTAHWLWWWLWVWSLWG